MLEILANSLPQLLEGLQTTILLTILSLILGTLFGIFLAVVRIYGKFPLTYLVIIYEKVLRGIPLIVIFFLLYFGLSQLGLPLEPFDAAILGLGLRGAAYQAQVFRTSINSIPEGQMIAARSLGMSKLSSIVNIIIPQMLRLSVPGWSNEFTIVLKDTSIAFSIGVIELMRQGRYVYVNNPDYTLSILLVIALIYFVLVFSANKGLGYLEKKYKMSGFEVGVER